MLVVARTVELVGHCCLRSNVKGVRRQPAGRERNLVFWNMKSKEPHLGVQEPCSEQD